MANEEASPAPRRPSPSHVLMGLLLLVTAHTDWNGYRFGDSNLSIQVPLIKHYAHPHLYAGDPLIETSSRYTSFFIPALGRFERAFDHLETTYFVLFITTLVLGLYALWCISIAVFDDPKSAALLTVLALAPIESLGGEIEHSSRFTHTMLAHAALLWAFYFYLSRREGLAFLLTGVVFNVHALYAAYVLTMLALDTAVRWRRVGLGSIARRLAFFLLPALPAIVWSLKSREPLDPSWVELLKTRSEHHSFPLAWGGHQYVSYLLLLALAALGAGAGARKDAERTILHFAAAVALLALAAVVFTEYVPVKIAFQGQFFRATRFLTVLALAYVAGVLVKALESPGIWGKAGALLAFLALFLPHLFGGALAVALLALVFVRHRHAPLAASIFCCGALALRGFYPPPQTPPQETLADYVSAFHDLFFGEEVLLCAALFAIWVAVGVKLPRARAFTTVLVVSILVLYALPLENRSFQHRLRRSRWVDVQLWARDNTPETATFITPPLLAGFRVFSERPIVGEWKDGTQQYFSDRFAFEWWRRMEDLGAPDENFESLTEARLRTIAERYGARYLVAPTRREPLGFPHVYSNRAYTVYRLDTGNARE